MSPRSPYLLMALLASGPAVSLCCGGPPPRPAALGPALALAPPGDQGGAAELAIVQASAAVVRTGPSSIAPPLTVVQADRQVVVRAAGAEWCEVYMQDGPPGYILTSALELTGLGFHPDEPPEGQPEVVTIAYGLLWTPYRWGGASPDGFDCSGLVQHVFRQVGVTLPRTAAEQWRVGYAVARKELSAGDRVYFAGPGGRISHTGIYCGSAREAPEFIHASGRHGSVVISSLDDPHYARMYAGARR